MAGGEWSHQLPRHRSPPMAGTQPLLQAHTSSCSSWLLGLPSREAAPAVPCTPQPGRMEPSPRHRRVLLAVRTTLRGPPGYKDVLPCAPLKRGTDLPAWPPATPPNLLLSFPASLAADGSRRIVAALAGHAGTRRPRSHGSPAGGDVEVGFSSATQPEGQTHQRRDILAACANAC